MILTVNNLIEKINESNHFSSSIDDEDLQKSAIRLVLSLINNQNVFFGTAADKEECYHLTKIANHDDLVSRIRRSRSLFVFQTSGTTGTPKTVKKTIDVIEKGIVAKQGLSNTVWGFCYSTRHISGLYVILQAIYTGSTIVDLRNLSGNALAESLIQNKVTNISAPTTFYKLNFPLVKTVESIKVVTNGGEPLSIDAYNNIIKSCPNSIIKNVYASTEFGSLLISDSETFVIPEKLKEKVKLIDSRIWVHKSLLSNFEGSDVEWYDTKDKVRTFEDGSFEILGRISEDVKVLGHLVSIRKVEEIISRAQQVKVCKIIPKFHKVFGTILLCEVVANVSNEEFNLKQLKEYLKEYLKSYEIPQKIELVNEIETTYSGKLKR